MKTSSLIRCLSALFVLGIFHVDGAEKPQEKIWIDPEVALTEDPDFSIQGEYGSAKAGESIEGVQVVALGGGMFEAYVLQDGLPGAGWNPAKTRTLLKGERKEDKIVFESSDPSTTAVIQDGKWTMTHKTGKQTILQRIERKSPTLGMAACKRCCGFV